MSLIERVDGRKAGIGAAVGVTAYLLGYLLVYVTQRGSVEEQLRGFNFVTELFGGEPIPAWQAVGWLFYNAHFVDTEIPGFGGTRTENFIASADDGSLALLYLLPPLFLLGAGFAVAYLSGIETPNAGGVVGTLVVVGYLPLAVVGAFAFGYGIGDGTIAPDVVTAVLLAGVVYPAVFGGLGGMGGGAFATRAESVPA